MHARIHLERIDAADARLGRLLQLYIHEWSALLPNLMPGPDALYTYARLGEWNDRERHRAVLFVVDGAPVGFALTARHPGPPGEAVVHVEELFIVAGARRRGVGAAAAAALFADEPGAWTLTVRPENAAALAFWRALSRSAASARESVEVGADGIARTRLSFHAP